MGYIFPCPPLLTRRLMARVQAVDNVTMAWDNSTTLLAAVLVLLAYVLIHVTCAILGHRLQTHTRRHDIIVDARRRRETYCQTMEQRRGPAT